MAAQCLWLPGCSNGAAATEDAETLPEPICHRGDTRLCFGPGACEGAQVCLESGEGYDECDCGEAADAGPAGDDSPNESQSSDDAGAEPVVKSEPDEGPSGSDTDVAPGPKPTSSSSGNGGGGGTPPPSGNEGRGGAISNGEAGGDGAASESGGGTGGEATGVAGSGSAGAPIATACPAEPQTDDATIAARLETLLGTGENVLQRSADEGWSLADSADRERVLDALWSESAVRARVIDLQLELFELLGPLDGVDDTLEASFLQEARLLVTDLTARDASFTDYYTTRESHFDDAVAAAYGVTAPAVEWGAGTLPEERQGVLLLGAWLAGHPGTTRRGAAVTAIRSCAVVPTHPDSLDYTMVPGPTTREAMIFTVQSDVVCTTCHGLTEPIGFGFLEFDDAGGYRTEENGYPIDASGELSPTGTRFDDAVALTDLLGAEDSTAQCVAEQLFQLAGLEQTAEARCHLDQLSAALGASSSFREALSAVVTSDAFSAAP